MNYAYFLKYTNSGKPYRQAFELNDKMPMEVRFQTFEAIRVASEKAYAEVVTLYKRQREAEPA